VTNYPSRATTQPTYSVTQPAYQVVTYYPSRVYQQAAYSVITNYPSRVTAGTSGTATTLQMTGKDGTTYLLTAPGTATNVANYAAPPVATAVYATLYAPVVKELANDPNEADVTLGTSPAGQTNPTYRPFVNVKYDGNP